MAGINNARACMRVCAVNDWRSVWQMDMRYSDATPDDLIRDIADVHVDVKLRAIVTCARAAEFAARLSPGKHTNLCFVVIIGT